MWTTERVMFGKYMAVCPIVFVFKQWNAARLNINIHMAPIEIPDFRIHICNTPAFIYLCMHIVTRIVDVLYCLPIQIQTI